MHSSWTLLLLSTDSLFDSSYLQLLSSDLLKHVRPVCPLPYAFTVVIQGSFNSSILCRCTAG